MSAVGAEIGSLRAVRAMEGTERETLAMTAEDLHAAGVVREMHRWGINTRYLGVVRHRIRSPRVRQIILNEMAALTLAAHTAKVHGVV